MALLTNINGKFSVDTDGAASFNRIGASETTGFTFPSADGANGEVLKTNGLGTVSWLPDSNTGTVTGTGVANKVAYWTSATNIDDGPITFATNDSTFAGTVLIDGVSNYTGLTVKGSGASRPQIKFSNVNQGVLGQIYGTEANALVTTTIAGLEYQVRNANGTSGDHVFKSYNTAILTLNGATNAATFAGNLTLNQYLEISSTTAQYAYMNLGASAGYGWQIGKAPATGGVVDDQGFYLYNLNTGYQGVNLAVLKSGNVGIGTTSPVSTWLSGFDPSTGNSTFKLTSESWIVTPMYTGLAAYYPGQGARPIIWSDAGGTNIQNFDNNTTDGVSIRSSNGSTKLFVREDGNVGIGTTSPNYKLSVANASTRIISATYIDGTNGIMSHAGAPNYGLESFQVRGDSISFWTDYDASHYQGTEKMRIDNNGVIQLTSGINGYLNTNSIGMEMDINRNPETGAFKDAGLSHARIIMRGDTTANGGSNIKFVTSPTVNTVGATKMTITGDGNVGIGTTPSGYLTIGYVARLYGGTQTYLTFNNSTHTTQVVGGFAIGNDAAAARIIQRENQPIIFSTNDIDRMVISSSGNVTVGGTSQYSGTGVTSLNIQSTNYPLLAFYVGTTFRGFIIIYSDSIQNYINHATGKFTWANTTATQGELSGTGTLTVKGDVIAYGTPSDKRLKENIKPIESALDKAMKLQGVTFDWKQKEDAILEIKEDIGFIAQDVQKVVPELVRENEDGMLSMRHQGVAPILLEAIKELKAEIEELKLNKCNCKCKK